MEEELGPGLADLYWAQHRSLFRLAVLLTGDTGAAEAVVLDTFAALHRSRRRPGTGDDALRSLRRLVVARARLVKRHPRHDHSEAPARAGACGPAEDQLGPPQFVNSPMARALQTLPTGQREAIVLTLYLDLTDEQAAAAMRVSQSTLRRRLDEARAALRATLAATP